MHHRSTIIGRLTKNPQLQQVGNGQNVAKFRVAASRSRKLESAEDIIQWEHYDNLFIDVECWGKLACNVASSLQKGAPVICVGYLVTNEWESDGKHMSRIVLKASYVGADLNRWALQSFQRDKQNEGIPSGKSEGESVTLDTKEPAAVAPF